MDSPASCELSNVLNFRDVGKTVNDFLGHRIVKEGLFYRSARPDDASSKDRTILKDVLGMKTVVDLRSKTELIKAARKHQAQLAAPALLQSHHDAAEPLQIPGLTYQEIKITGRPFELYLVRQLSWWSFLKFLLLMIIGYRMEAISILGKEIMLPRGLVGLGMDTLDQSGVEIASVLKTFIEPGALPILVHCTQGKDRTGLIVGLALMILGVSIDAIDYDYKLTDGQLEPEREARMAEIRELGLTEDWFLTAPTMMARIAEHLDEIHGGLESYLDKNGFGESERQQMRDLLLY